LVFQNIAKFWHKNIAKTWANFYGRSDFWQYLQNLALLGNHGLPLLGKRADMVNCKLITAWHHNSEPGSCAVSVIPGNKLSVDLPGRSSRR